MDAAEPLDPEASMNAREASVPKSLIIVPFSLLLITPALADQPPHRAAAVTAGRSVSHDAREAWFRQSVGDILEGRVAATPRQDTAH